MSDYLIDFHTAIEAMSRISDSICEAEAVDALCELPTVDAVPVTYIEKQIEDNIKLADSIRAKGGEEIADVVLRYAMNLKVFLIDWEEGK